MKSLKSSLIKCFSQNIQTVKSRFKNLSLIEIALITTMSAIIISLLLRLESSAIWNQKIASGFSTNVQIKSEVHPDANLNSHEEVKAKSPEVKAKVPEVEANSKEFF
ncbi:MAG: hypothetical protein ATN31_02065 [Candidatus Epulonipiscioides saccharophilum]|nr:MAG: hypothetical protein ATN31_02065 [Epulopiscium sp. AS2M-Bin001]